MLPSRYTELIAFIEAARRQGSSDEFIAKLLKSYGWPQREIERAFYQLFEQLTGQPIPTPRSSSGEGARDTFIYLVIFTTLSLWTQAVAELAFIFIDYSIIDAVNPPWGNPAWQVSFCLARLLVSYPIFLVGMGLVNRETARQPEKSYSGVRNWLTYLALLIAALIGMIALISFLASFLQGALTLRFSLQILVVLLLDGGVLGYYLQWLRRRPGSYIVRRRTL